MTSIFFHIRRPTTQENVSYILDFYVSADVHFSRFEELKITFFTSFQFALELKNYRVSCFWRSVNMYLTEINAKTSFT